VLGRKIDVLPLDRSAISFQQADRPASAGERGRAPHPHAHGHRPAAPQARASHRDYRHSGSRRARRA